MSEQQSKSENTAPKEIRPISLSRFAIQLQNVVPLEIVAKRFPLEMGTNPQVNLQINIDGIHIDSSTSQAQTILNVNIEPEPRSFELFIKIVGLFSYSPNYSLEEVQQYLRHGSISVLLPFARELATSLCTRLQIPIVMLPLIQLADPNDIEMNN